MAIIEVTPQGIFSIRRGRAMGHWFHEEGMPGWTRAWHGYPYLHWSEVGFTPRYDKRQELEVLREEAKDLESALQRVRERIGELQSPSQ